MRPGQEIGRRVQAFYEWHLRHQVETPEKIGREIVIDVESGDYEIDACGLAASQRLMARRPGAPLYGVRVGYNAVYAIGGVLEPIWQNCQQVRHTPPAETVVSTCKLIQAELNRISDEDLDDLYELILNFNSARS